MDGRVEATGRIHAFSWLLRRLGDRAPSRPGGPGPAPGPREAGRAGTHGEPEPVRLVRERLGSPPDLVVRPIEAASRDGARLPGPRRWVLFLETLTDVATVSNYVVRPLAAEGRPPGGAGVAFPLIHVPDVRPIRDVDEGIRRLLDGWTLVVQEADSIWAADTASRPGRQVNEPDSETGIRVPREGFNEQIETGLALIRARIRHPGLRAEQRRFGSRTATRVVLVYIEGLAAPELLATVRARLDRIAIDGVLESGYVEEFIEDSPYSPFPQTLRTERPDVVVGNLLEGRFAILVDGTPFALVGPVVLPQLLTVSEDYYERAVLSSWVRILRYAAFGLSLVLPGTYVAVTTYHQEVIPTSLLLSIAAAREGVPFPALVEALLMELQFEVLREAGVRLPRAVGPAISIVGALVLGQAAISANLVSPAMVIVVAMTAIASFATPVFSVALAARLLRFAFTVAGATMGLFGVQAVAVLVLVHLCALRSFGIPYLAPLAPMRVRDWRDVTVRLPWWAMRRRPAFISAPDRVRAPSTKGRGEP